MATIFTFIRTQKEYQTVHSCFKFQALSSTFMLVSMLNITSASAAGHLREFIVPQQARSPVEANHSSNIILLENELLMWVNAVGKRDHTVFDHRAKLNRITPLAAIYVDRRPGFGHFSMVQAAIDHVPVNNHHRVHIIVAPGVYK